MIRSLAGACLTLWLAGLSLAHAAEPLSAEKAADIRKLMEASGALRIGQMITQNAVGQIPQGLKTKRPDLPDETYTLIAEEVGKVVGEEMSAKGGYIEQMTAVFDKYLTQEEVRGLLAFYGTPLGRKTVNVMPMIGQESARIGQRWVQSLGPKVDTRLKARLAERGIKLDSPPAASGAPAAPSSSKPAK